MSRNPEGIGVDLLQYRGRAVSAFGANWPPVLEPSLVSQKPSVAILPIHDGESPIFGADAADHRRSVGLAWPLEAQAPFASDPRRGIGRIPLICSWAKLMPPDATGDGWVSSLADARFQWTPNGAGHPISVSAGKIIAGSAAALTKTPESPMALVVPDALSEAAQQVVLDEARPYGLSTLTLLPRPIAVALPWCHLSASHWKGRYDEDEEGSSIGHLRVAALGLSCWEVSVVEIRARRFKNRTWLVPVRHRPKSGIELPMWGLPWLANLAAADSRSASETWFRLFGGDFLTEVLSRPTDPAHHRLAEQSLLHGWLAHTKGTFGSWDVFRATFEARGLTDLRSNVLDLVNSQLTNLESTANTHLGTIVDGELTPLALGSSSTLGQKFAEILGSGTDTRGAQITDGNTASRGAALAAVALHRGLPCYRDTLVPIDIHAHGRDRFGDLTTVYKSLVEGRTVEAGREYRPDEPIRGLKIKDGARALDLTLRRPVPGGYAYRKITAELSKPTTRDEPVRIRVAVRPGQGFAKAYVESEREGVFTTRLDWRHMTQTSEPLPPKLDYLPGVTVIEPDDYLWREAEDDIRRTVNLSQDPYRAKEQLQSLTKRINRWPLADRVDRQRGFHLSLKDNPFRHYGTIGSDGDIDKVKDPALLKRLIAVLSERFGEEPENSKLARQIQRTAGWLYLAAPNNITRHVRRRFKLSVAMIHGVDIQTAGLTWADPKDFQLFFSAFSRRIVQPDVKPNPWLQALRNIVRFREHALADESLPWDGDTRDKSEQLRDTILEPTLSIMSDEFYAHRLKVKYNNCLYAALYILKRRRYDASFLDSGDSCATQLQRLLTEALSNRLLASARQRLLIDATLKFLKGEATRQDVSRVLEDDEADDDDGE